MRPLRALQFFAPAEQRTLLHVLNLSKSMCPMMAMIEDMEEYTAVTDRAGRREAVASIPSVHPPEARKSPDEISSDRVSGDQSLRQESLCRWQGAETDLIVMGARGVGPIKERLFSSVSHNILTLAPCATLIVHGPVKAMKQILLPLQGPSDADAAVRFLQLKPFHDAVEVTLLTVLPSTEPPGPGDAATAYAEILEKQTDSIKGAAERLRTLGYQAHEVAVVGEPATTILQEASTRGSDLILMGTRGRQGITRLVLGSVSHAVLHKMPCPVLVFTEATVVRH